MLLVVRHKHELKPRCLPVLQIVLSDCSADDVNGGPHFCQGVDCCTRECGQRGHNAVHLATAMGEGSNVVGSGSTEHSQASLLTGSSAHCGAQFISICVQALGNLKPRPGLVIHFDKVNACKDSIFGSVLKLPFLKADNRFT